MSKITKKEVEAYRLGYFEAVDELYTNSYYRDGKETSALLKDLYCFILDSQEPEVWREVGNAQDKVRPIMDAFFEARRVAKETFSNPTSPDLAEADDVISDNKETIQ